MTKKLYGEYPKEILDIRNRFIKHPLVQHLNSVGPSQAAGAAELAFYRGQHAGRHDAYKVLRRQYPEAAKAILKKYGMERNGTIIVRFLK